MQVTQKIPKTVFSPIPKKQFLRALTYVLCTFLLWGCDSRAQEYKKTDFNTGLAELDEVRASVLDSPTIEGNFKERQNALMLWIRYLSYAGADLNSLRDYFVKNVRDGKTPEIYQAIDFSFQELEKISREFEQNPDQYLVALKREGEGNSETRDWPTLRGDEGQTGFTTQSGPLKGRLKWKFAAGHAWYATPAFDAGKVYMPSPGVSYEAYCIDTETGEYIWKTRQKENQNQYRTPRNSSPAMLSGNHLIVREIGSGGNRRNAKHFVYIDKNSGKEVKEVYAGHVDYRAGYAAFDGNDDFLVYPHSLQEIGAGQTDIGVKVVSFDSLICVGTQMGKRQWEHYMGEFYSEPLIDGQSVYCGNFQGVMKSLDIESGAVNWEVKTGAAINSKASVAKRSVIVGNQNGFIISFDTKSGKKLWETKLPLEERSFQQFSKVLVNGDELYVGSTDKKVYCLDRVSGEITWEVLLDDWIRSSPVLIDGILTVATVKGTVYGIDLRGGKPFLFWENTLSDHGIYADLREYEGSVYVSSSDYFLSRIDPQTGRTKWKTSIFESVIDEKGNRILADLVGGGPDYQAGTTISNGVAYFGSPRFVYAVDIASGEELWKFETRGQICGAPAVANGRVFFGQQGGTDQFYCVDAKTGSLLWKNNLKWTWASPNVKEGKVYLATVDGTFYCCDQASGDVLWKYESKEGAYPAPSFKGDIVYFGSWNGNYYAFDKDTGELKWNADIEGHPDSGSTIVMGDYFYAQGFASKFLYALNADTGAERWKVTLNGEWCNASPVSDGKHVLFSTYLPWLHQAPFPSHTYCVDVESGELLYKQPFAGGLTGAVICKDLVFTASTTDSYMRAWDVADGNIRWQYRMGGRAEETCTSVYGDKAFILADDGYLYAFE